MLAHPVKAHCHPHPSGTIYQFANPFELLERPLSTSKGYVYRNTGFREEALRTQPNREHGLWAVLNGVRYITRAGVPDASSRLVEDTRGLLRDFVDSKDQPTAACIDSRRLLSTPESEVLTDSIARRDASAATSPPLTFSYFA